MPLARYGVPAGRVVGRRAEGGTDTPHYPDQGQAESPSGSRSGRRCSSATPTG
jgi:hypothetical protein